MHQLSLYGQVAKEDHRRFLQQLAGYTRMQPQDATDIHLVFKPRIPSGLDNLPSAGGSQTAQQQDVQRIKTMLLSGLHYIQVVGIVSAPPSGTATDAKGQRSVKWSLEFNDTPMPGKEIVSTRQTWSLALEDGDIAKFLDDFGFEYVSRYMVVGSKFYDNNTTIFVHKVLKLPQVTAANSLIDTSFLEEVEKLPELDGSGSFVVSASIDMVDGNSSELKDRAIRQLLTLKESLKQAVNLTPGDRLALDTRMPVSTRR